jgi:hypothetical protein
MPPPPLLRFCRKSLYSALEKWTSGALSEANFSLCAPIVFSLYICNTGKLLGWVHDLQQEKVNVLQGTVFCQERPL